MFFHNVVRYAVVCEEFNSTAKVVNFLTKSTIVD